MLNLAEVEILSSSSFEDIKNILRKCRCYFNWSHIFFNPHQTSRLKMRCCVVGFGNEELVVRSIIIWLEDVTYLKCVCYFLDAGG